MTHKLRPAVILLVTVMLGPLSANAQSENSAPDGETVTIFAAASLAPALEETTPLIEKETGVTLRVSYAGSATLARQIAAGAPANLYISADRRWVDWLSEETPDRIISVAPFAQNALVLAYAPMSGVPLFEAGDLISQLTGAQRIAVGDPRIAPLGHYGAEVLTALELTDVLADRLIYGQDARTTLAYVESSAVDVGLIYLSDAISSAKVNHSIPIPREYHSPIIYMLVQLDGAPATARIREMLEGETVSRILSNIGLRPLGAR